jgi:indole-3-glycerol phosphate synthase
MTTTGAPDLLLAIVAAARRITETRRESTPEAALEREVANRRPRGEAFSAALTSAPSPRVIAECKRRSPSRGILRQEYDAPAHARAYAAAGAAAISVLTEPTFFDGSLEDLRRVRDAVDLPLLRKDFIVTRYQLLEAAAAGADAALLIVGALTDAELRELIGVAQDINLATLVEVHDATELARALDAGAAIVGVNSRNLRTLAVDTSAHDALAAAIPPHVVAVAESGLRTRDDLYRLERVGYSAFLVGERLIVESDPGDALRRLRGTR